jgi:DNA-binding YbaB/EbfC family protein
VTPEDESGGLDLGALLSQLGEVQNSLRDAQESAAAQVVEGSAGGGAVRVTLTGGFEFQSVSIRPDVVDASEVEMLEDLVLAAIRDGLERANDLQQDVLGGDPSAALGGIFGALSAGGDNPFGDFGSLGEGLFSEPPGAVADEDPTVPEGSGEPTDG